MHKKAAFKRLRPATLLKKRLWHWCFLVNFVKFLGTPFLQNTSGRLLLYYAKEEDREQIEISIISELTKKIIKNKKNVLTFFIFYLLCSSFFFLVTFYKEALCFIIFMLSLCSNMLNLENILIYTSKIKKNMLILKFDPGMKFHLGKNV